MRLPYRSSEGVLEIDVASRLFPSRANLNTSNGNRYEEKQGHCLRIMVYLLSSAYLCQSELWRRATGKQKKIAL